MAGGPVGVVGAHRYSAQRLPAPRSPRMTGLPHVAERVAVCRKTFRGSCRRNARPWRAHHYAKRAEERSSCGTGEGDDGHGAPAVGADTGTARRANVATVRVEFESRPSRRAAFGTSRCVAPRSPVVSRAPAPGGCAPPRDGTGGMAGAATYGRRALRSRYRHNHYMDGTLSLLPILLAHNLNNKAMWRGHHTMNAHERPWSMRDAHRHICMVRSAPPGRLRIEDTEERALLSAKADRRAR